MGGRRIRGFFGSAIAAGGLLALTLATAVATPLQAPGSLIALDLPVGYAPSELFSGFTNEALGVSFVVVEMPGSAWDEIAAGMTPDALAAKGVKNARRGPIARPEPAIYMQAEQTSPAGDFAKFFVVFREADVTALVTANVPKAALQKGEISVAAIEKVLASAEVRRARAPATELFELGYLGPFKLAGSVLGSARSYTLDGLLSPPDRGKARPVLIVAPSLDRRPVGDLPGTAERLLAGVDGLSDVKIGEKTELRVAGLPGLVITATAHDRLADADVTVYQLVLASPVGGHFRILAQIPTPDAEALLPEVRRIALSFKPLK